MASQWEASFLTDSSTWVSDLVVSGLPYFCQIISKEVITLTCFKNFTMQHQNVSSMTLLLAYVVPTLFMRILTLACSCKDFINGWVLLYFDSPVILFGLHRANGWHGDEYGHGWAVALHVNSSPPRQAWKQGEVSIIHIRVHILLHPLTFNILLYTPLEHPILFILFPFVLFAVVGSEAT